MNSPLLITQCLTAWLGFMLLGTGLTYGQQQPAKAVQFPAASPNYANARFDILPIPAEANTWGFEIYVEGKRFIRQPSIPALPGNRGFATQAKARQAAELMVLKIRRGEMPPSLTKEELQKAKLI